MVDVSSQSNKVNITVSSSGVSSNVNASGDTTLYYSNKAREWAISNRIVDGVDYSSKYYAGKANESALNAQSFAQSALETLNNVDNKVQEATENIEIQKQDVITEIENLSEQEQNKIVDLGIDTRANVDLSNLSEAGQAKFDEKANANLDNLTTAGSNIANWSVNVANCIKEIPQRIKYTLANGTLTILASSVVTVPYGTEDLTSQYPKGATFLHENFKVYDTQFADDKFFVLAEVQRNVSSNEPETAVRTRYVAMDITNNVLERFSGTVSGDSSITPDTWDMFYRTDLNQVGITGANKEILQQGDISFPFMVVLGDGTNSYGSIKQVFNGFGYIGSTVWVDKGIKGLIPNDKNGDKTLKNIEFTTNRVMTNHVYGTQTRVIAIDADHLQLPLLSDYRYNQITNHNLYKETTQAVECIAGIVETNNNAISRFQTKQPFQALDANTVNAWLVDSYTNGKSGYIIYSNNYCEQWGFNSNATSGSHTTITLLKPYASTDYTVLVTYNTSSTTTAGGTQWAVSKMTTTNFAIGSQGGSYAWRAYGYLP